MNEVYIVGAGASCDFNLPLGIRLLFNLHEDWKTNHASWSKIIADIYKNKFQEGWHSENNKYLSTITEEQIKNNAEKLYYSGADSIDDFMTQYTEDFTISTLCKLSIIKEILLGEHRSNLTTGSLYPSEQRDNKHFVGIFGWSENWLRIFFRKRIKKDSFATLVEDTKKNRIDFIIFNYDRCIEHFLYTAITNYYNLDLNKDSYNLKEIFKNIHFHHVYGSPAPLPWQKTNDTTCIPYGEHVDIKSISKYADYVKNIKTIRGAERIENLKEYQRIITDSSKIFVLGLSYNSNNFEIFPQKEFVYDDSLIITTKGMSDSDLNNIETKLFPANTQTNIIASSGKRSWTVIETINHSI